MNKKKTVIGAKNSPIDLGWAGLRADLALVAELVPDHSRVLDLGCGSGRLLKQLIDHKSCSGTGVEKNPKMVLQAIHRGVPLIELDLDTQLGEFSDDSYDIVVLSKTLQAVLKPEEVLKQMARIAPKMVVSMPNFGFWRHRINLLTGHMPRSRDLPYQWYDTPNLHHATLVDLEVFFKANQLKVEKRVPLDALGRKAPSRGWFANLMAGSAIYVLSRES